MEQHAHQPRVVIAGGGVGAVEAALAVRALAGPTPTIDLISPNGTFVYRPMAVTEPFGGTPYAELDLEDLHHSHDVRRIDDAVASVRAEDRIVVLRSGEEVSYDALVVAIGATPRAWLDGAVTFAGRPDVEAVRGVLDGVRAGDVEELLFASPPGASWTLPLYELALLTAAWIADEGLSDIRLSLATAADQPLGEFGPSASRTVRDMLGDRGVRFLDTQVTGYDHAMVTLAGSRAVRADAVITMAELTGNPLPGLPADDDGFIPVDDLMTVHGAEGIWAVGDATTFPIKQGGLAAQEADTAASVFAGRLGAPVEPLPFQPVLRGMLLTGVTSAYLRGDGVASETAFSPLWWPPTKLAGRYLAPYLADRHELDPSARELEDRHPVRHAGKEREEMRRLAVEFAEADALWGDYESALRWLRTLEWIDGVLPAQQAELRARWELELATR